MKSRFYITTAIDYPSGQPHMGHAYEKIITDTYARWHRFLGDDVFFLTGTDENGQKLSKAAAGQGKDTQAFVDANVETFRKLCKELQISNDDFIRTTEPRHHQAVNQIWTTLKDKGAIYFDRYSGLYCIECEAFYTESQVTENKCPVHGTDLDRVEEDGYFFKMSEYHDWIVSYLKDHPSFIAPASARKEILSRLEQAPLKDLSISRPNKDWGIPVPGDDKHVIYTWFDALINYFAAVNTDGRRAYWPAQVHVIGRDILWFHTVIWPIMLHVAGLGIPEQVYVHGMVLGKDGRKMGKSAGNGVTPEEALALVPLDSFRYYLLRAIPSGGDGAFVPEDLVGRHNSQLGNDYGNLLMRVVKFARKRVGDRVEFQKDFKAAFQYSELLNQVTTAMAERDHTAALDRIWEKIIALNVYINDSAPWKIKEDDRAVLEILYNALYGIHVVTCLLSAFLPRSSEEALKALGTQNSGMGTFPFEGMTFQLSEPAVLFPRIDA